SPASDSLLALTTTITLIVCLLCSILYMVVERARTKSTELKIRLNRGSPHYNPDAYGQESHWFRPRQSAGAQVAGCRGRDRMGFAGPEDRRANDGGYPHTQIRRAGLARRPHGLRPA